MKIFNFLFCIILVLTTTLSLYAISQGALYTFCSATGYCEIGSRIVSVTCYIRCYGNAVCIGGNGAKCLCVLNGVVIWDNSVYCNELEEWLDDSNWS